MADDMASRTAPLPSGDRRSSCRTTTARASAATSARLPRLGERPGIP